MKQKIDDAKIANLREQFPKQGTIFFSCIKSTLLAPIARYSVQLHFWLHEFNKYRYFQKHKLAFSKETEVNNRLTTSSRRHSCLLTDNFLFEGGWGWLASKKSEFLYSVCRRNKNRA